MTGYSSKRVRVSGCAYHVACVDSSKRVRLSRCVTIWHSKQVRLNSVLSIFGMRGYSSKRAHLSGCAYHLARVDTVLLQRVRLPFGMRGYSSKRVHLSGRAYHLARARGYSSKQVRLNRRA